MKGMIVKELPRETWLRIPLGNGWKFGLVRYGDKSRTRPFYFGFYFILRSVHWRIGPKVQHR